MPNIDTHAPGSFCWVELATTDQKAAKTFYTSLLGWTVNEMEMGPDYVYYIFQVNGRDAAAGYGMNAGLLSQGVPSHWALYISVTSADHAAARAEAAGGKVLAPPFDVGPYGRMAVLQDPTGAAINVWEAKSSVGIRINGEQGTLCWGDLSTPDPEAALRFYKSVFDWETTPQQGRPRLSAHY